MEVTSDIHVQLNNLATNGTQRSATTDTLLQRYVPHFYIEMYHMLAHNLVVPVFGVLMLWQMRLLSEIVQNNPPLKMFNFMEVSHVDSVPHKDGVTRCC